VKDKPEVAREYSQRPFEEHAEGFGVANDRLTAGGIRDFHLAYNSWMRRR
jgi:hypothetical protein